MYDFLYIFSCFSIPALLGRLINDTENETNDIKNDYDIDNSDDDHHPDFIIPVSVHVTDVNDNTPKFVGKMPYRLNISEITLVSVI